MRVTMVSAKMDMRDPIGCVGSYKMEFKLGLVARPKPATPCCAPFRIKYVPLCSPWDRRATTNFGRWRIQCLPRFVNWHFLISLAKFFPSGSFLDASAGEPVASFFLQRRVTQSLWDRRSTTNFERWRIQSLPRFVNWHFLISLAKLCPSIARLARTPMAGHLLFNLL